MEIIGFLLMMQVVFGPDVFNVCVSGCGAQAMKILFIAIMALTLGGCMNTAPYGYRDYDPCISCGDSWKFYPNEPGGAQATINRLTNCEANWNCSK